MQEKDIRLLTLCKQHYLDFYNIPLKTTHSCLGYYDGMNIKEITPEESSIFCKKSNSPISDIWYGIGKNVQNLYGGVGSQNIGIFRRIEPNENTRVQEFWENLENFPYVSVGLIKINDISNYKKIGSKIEDYTKKGERTDKICDILTYYTFDNADLVAIAAGNSILQLKTVFESIENMEEVRYLHIIMGISDTYLEYVKNQMESGRSFELWHHVKCFTDDIINKLCLQMATSGDGGVYNQFKRNMENYAKDKDGKCLFDPEYAYVMGHANINVVISNIRVKYLLAMLVPEAILTHQNGIYGKGLYNIESYIKLEKTETDTEAIVENEKKGSWCVEIIQKYCSQIQKPAIRQDEGLYAYLQALLQTLNTLAQYERFSISKDVFHLVIPSFLLFEKQLARTLEQSEEINETMKQAFCVYLEYVNSVLYHTIHTNQVYLMIPGYSGTAFAIPIKLNILYAWFVESVKNVLNDTERRYAFILIPVIEIKPCTREIGLKVKGEERLIGIKISQRMLSFPRNLMIILAHELGHYVGSKLRCRKIRLECLVKTLAEHLAEGICIKGEHRLSEHEEKMREFREDMKRRLTQQLVRNIQYRIKAEKKDGHFYLDDITPMLKAIGKEVIIDDVYGRDVYEIIHTIPDKWLRWAVKNKKKELEKMRAINGVQKEMDSNRKNICISGAVDLIVNDLIKIYGEVFSDITAIALLECEREDFIEAFHVSDGAKSKIQSKERDLRIGIADCVVYNTAAKSRDISKNVCADGEKYENDIQKWVQGIYGYVWVWEYLLVYARECYEKLIVCTDGKMADVEKLRNIYRYFTSREKTCDEIYDKIVESMREYSEMVKNLLLDM